MAKFAKIYEIDENTQVLFTKRYMEETNEYIVEMSSDLGDVFAAVKFSYGSAEDGDNAFNTFEEQMVRDFVQNVRKDLNLDQEEPNE